MIGKIPVLLAFAAAQFPFPHQLRHYETPEKHQIETMPGGLAVLDYDNDGLPDIFFTNGAPQPALKKQGAPDCNRLYRNAGNGRFEDVTLQAKLCGSGYDVAVAAGDFDNDGDADLFVAGVGNSSLYRNDAGVFTAVAIPEVKGWAIGAGWFDFDLDGDLDLFIVRYVDWDALREPFCGDATQQLRTYCHPRYYDGLTNLLYRNDGSKGFTDVSRSSGIGARAGKGMAVAFGDADGDGRLDAFVTNDTVPNFLFRNRGDGTFEEIAGRAGVAYNDDGRALSSMGADFRDIDNDGLDDVFVTALHNETFPFYRNAGKALFDDWTYPSKIGKATMAFSGWGCGIYDLDNDGRKDLFVAAGDVQTNTEKFSSRASRQQNLILYQQADGSFRPQAVGGAAWHRGAAFADFNGDGFIDAVVSRLGESPILLYGSPNRNRWLRLVLQGKSSNRDAIGAAITIGNQKNHLSTAVGYASASEKVVHFGLGSLEIVPEVRIRWPNGREQRLRNVKTNQVLRVTEMW